MNDGSAMRDRNYGGNSYRKVGRRHEHRIVAERILGRPLKADEVVHHKDHSRRNNSPDNLEVMTRAEHSRMHTLERGARSYS